MTDTKLLTNASLSLFPWYDKNHRELPWRKDCDPYHIWISEIMLQQTRVEAVKEYYRRFLTELPNIQALSRVSDEALMKLWQGLGYYNRASNLKKAAIRVVEEYNGTFPSDYESILSLPGIGSYTAGAIGSISFQLPTPAVDGNVLRIVSRLTDSKKNIDLPQVKKEIENTLREVYQHISAPDASNSGKLTQALMELGATICIPNGAPHCDRCPWNDLCLSKKRGTISERPVRSPKKGRRIEDRAVFILYCDDHVVIRKRPPKGLLANLWEFPNVLAEKESIHSMQDALLYAEREGYHPSGAAMQTCYTHIFSHVEWRMTAYFIEIRPDQNLEFFPSFSEIESDYALPSAFRPFWDLLKN